MISVPIVPACPVALMDMIGGPELLVVFLLVLIFFGGEKMPELARGLGKAIREFRKAASGVEQEFKRALEDEPIRPNQPPASTLPARIPGQHTILPPAANKETGQRPDAGVAHGRTPEIAADPGPLNTTSDGKDSGDAGEPHSDTGHPGSDGRAS